MCRPGPQVSGTTPPGGACGACWGHLPSGLQSLLPLRQVGLEWHRGQVYSAFIPTQCQIPTVGCSTSLGVAQGSLVPGRPYWIPQGPPATSRGRESSSTRAVLAGARRTALTCRCMCWPHAGDQPSGGGTD